MSLSKSGFKINTEPVPLESLRSPQVSGFAPNPTQVSTPQTDFDKLQERDSVSSSLAGFNDIALDDDAITSPSLETARPPPLNLSTKGDIHSRPSSRASANGDVGTATNNGRPHSVAFSISLDSPISNGKSHKKTTSTTTIRSSHMESEDEAFAKRRASVRGSIDGQQKLQEEFARLQKEEQDQRATAEGAIDWDFWGAVISDYPSFAAERPQELAQAIARGIPSTLRGMMWQHMAASKDPEMEILYLKLLKESSIHEKAITRDLGRTFPHHAFFTDGQGIGQENLFNVLKAYSLYDPQVGYCQGLPFVVAILLLNMPDEEAFSLLVKLMHVYDLRGHFLPEMPKLQMRLFQFDRLVEELLPVLHVHFLRQGIKSTMYCSQWFLTMFSYRFPLEFVVRIYDSCLANGIEAIFGFSIQLLRKNEQALLALKFDEILAFLNTKLLDVYLIVSIDGARDETPRYRIDEYVHESVSVPITSFMLDSFRHEYEDLMRETHKHKNLIDDLTTNNRQLTQQVKSLEQNFAQLNTEHVELLNELVKQRLKAEELEEELVRYKLLYAEAVHESEDAGSSHRISLANMMNGFKRGSSRSADSSR
ncbi:RabGAP/TBC [Coprinopsis marcescibilis]|uniref:RabGAP/TBC n=1 Tax=Coprinopsis marcescibilis TaxID=230819 RepID=A0A5C3KK93_COPMA|nr:RabGAP/TBC [Coprinopsis marcescibilis]